MKLLTFFGPGSNPNILVDEQVETRAIIESVLGDEEVDFTNSEGLRCIIKGVDCWCIQERSWSGSGRRKDDAAFAPLQHHLLLYGPGGNPYVKLRRSIDVQTIIQQVLQDEILTYRDKDDVKTFVKGARCWAIKERNRGDSVVAKITHAVKMTNPKHLVLYGPGTTPNIVADNEDDASKIVNAVKSGNAINYTGSNGQATVVKGWGCWAILERNLSRDNRRKEDSSEPN